MKARISAAAIVLLLFAGLWMLCHGLLPMAAHFPAGAIALILCLRWAGVIAEWLDD